MPLSWNEIKDRGLAFSRKWEDEESEDAEAKSFWDDFFNAFGISRRRGNLPYQRRRTLCHWPYLAGGRGFTAV